MPDSSNSVARVLSDAQLEQFIDHGFARLDEAFAPQLAEQARAILWQDLPCSPDEPSSWTAPVVRLGNYFGGPFEAAVNTPRLHAAFDQLVGAGRWLPRRDLGTFPVRFPSPQPPGDDGWHVDVSFPPDDPAAMSDFFAWRANVASRGRALLLLCLFSDVSEADAPTRLRLGSHRDMARCLAPHGEQGMSLHEMVAAEVFAASQHRPEAVATGPAGTVYLCHPLLVHAAQPHRGTTPRFLAQPPILPAPPGDLEPGSPVEQAIRRALAMPAG